MDKRLRVDLVKPDMWIVSIMAMVVMLVPGMIVMTVLIMPLIV